jgi:hypothetical protein
MVKIAMENSPAKSMRRLSAAVNLSEPSCRRIVKDILRMFPYKISILQEIKPGDYEKRVKLSEWMLAKLDYDESFLDHTFFSDEAHFHLCGYVNQQNYRFWATEKPDFSIQAPLHSQRITVWAAISRKHVIGPVFLNENVNADVYSEIIRNHLFPGLRHHKLVKKAWFQQDGATPHTANRVLELLRTKLGDRIISKGLWPPRSPDLTPCDYFLWGFLKDRVYIQRPKNLAELRESIEENFKWVNKEMLQRVSKNLISRLRTCLDHNGAHIE